MYLSCALVKCYSYGGICYPEVTNLRFLLSWFLFSKPRMKTVKYCIKSTLLACLYLKCALVKIYSFGGICYSDVTIKKNFIFVWL